jgi:hypothetical protein
MTQRRRAHIPYPAKLAAALACLLPQDQRDALRRAQGPPDTVLGLYHFDHIMLHCHEGPDAWWNLDPVLVPVHREKSRRDTAIAAKVKRLIDRQWAGAAPRPKRKIPSRGFPKGKRRFRSRP